MDQLKNYKDIQTENRLEGYYNHDLIICNLNRMPCNDKNIMYGLRDIAECADLPRVCFHSISHSSITCKSMLSNEDIKSVQGDSGHSQSKMVINLYSRVLDNIRKELSEKLNQEFFKTITVYYKIR